MRRTLLLSGMVLLLTTIGTAQTTVDQRPGLIGAGSPLYGIDLAADKAFVDWGITDPGTVAHERASEALDASEEGNDEARDRALNGLNEITENASSNNTADLAKAQAVLEELQQRVPDEAEAGLETAMDAVAQAQEQLDQVGAVGEASGGTSVIDRVPGY